MALWDRSWNVARGSRHSSDLDDELQFHLAMRARDNVNDGMSPEDAERDAGILRWLDSLARRRCGRVLAALRGRL